jgi:phage-related holin
MDSPDSFEVLYACIPRIKQDEFRFKSTFFGFVKHITEMIILGFIIFIDIIDENRQVR